MRSSILSPVALIVFPLAGNDMPISCFGKHLNIPILLTVIPFSQSGAPKFCETWLDCSPSIFVSYNHNKPLVHLCLCVSDNPILSHLCLYSSPFHFTFH